MIELAKQALDVGLYTNNRDDSLAFWRNEVGLPFSELLPVGGGVQQHRHLIGESVLKINHSRAPLSQAAAGGIRAITLHQALHMSEASELTELQDPDGNVVLVPGAGDDGLNALTVHLTVSSLQRHLDFYGGAMGLPTAGRHSFRCGVSRIELVEGNAVVDPEQRAPGYRYLTVQVFDVKKTHGDILRRGGREGVAPVKLGDVAHISFVRDPDGNWIEISQRKSLTGSLD
ncbi:MAG: VOC family protein [Gammaproteobacteria bacterium]|nr:VOC family protein [Gammaproteobacteria bacterium]